MQYSIIHCSGYGMGLSDGTIGKNPMFQYRRHKRRGFDPWIGKIPLEAGMATHSSILAWRIIHFILMTYLFYNWRFIPFDSLSHFA